MGRSYHNRMFHSLYLLFIHGYFPTCDSQENFSQNFLHTPKFKAKIERKELDEKTIVMHE